MQWYGKNIVPGQGWIAVDQEGHRYPVIAWEINDRNQLRAYCIASNGETLISGDRWMFFAAE